MLSVQNAHARDQRISFIDETHTYFVDGSSDGYISTTTLIHNLFPAFAADKIISKMMMSRNWGESKYYGQTRDEIKDGWEKNRDSAASLGTAMHQNIENFYNGQPHITDGHEWEMFCKFKEDHAQLDPFRSEMTVFAADVGIAGSIDMLYKDPNDPDALIMCDWKRSKEIKMSNKWQSGTHHLTEELDDCNYVHYSLQLAIYKLILQEYYGYKVNQTFILVLHPSQTGYLKIETKDVDDIVLKLFSERRARGSS